MKTITTTLLSLSLALSSLAQTPQASSPAPPSLDAVAGIYTTKPGAFISLAIFDPGDGENHLLFTDLTSGTIRVLAPGPGDIFAAGPALFVPSPIEMQLSFQRNGTKEATSLAIRKDKAAEETARRVACDRREITFKNGDVSLAGTLTMPADGKRHPGVVMLHGSGPLNRYSFGPFPDFFVSRGFAVLVYDKRGTGKSKGNLDASTLKDLVADGKAAVEFLSASENIEPGKIGLCGTSQGGFLAAAVAAENPSVAFIVNLYGMYVPVWQQELYRTEAELRAEQASDSEIAEALAFVTKEFEVGKTGAGWESLNATIQQSKEKKWWSHVTKSDSLDELRHYWDTLYSVDPSLPLQKVTCPVLALFGELDTSTPVADTIKNMREALSVAHNSNFTSHTFPKAGHGLLEVNSGASNEIPKSKRLAPELWETMDSWLQKTKSREQN